MGVHLTSCYPAAVRAVLWLGFTVTTSAFRLAHAQEPTSSVRVVGMFLPARSHDAERLRGSLQQVAQKVAEQLGGQATENPDGPPLDLGERIRYAEALEGRAAFDDAATAFDSLLTDGARHPLSI